MPLSRITSPFQSATANVYSPSANTVAIRTASTDRFTIDSSGRASLGTTPSNWGSGGTLEFTGQGLGSIHNTGGYANFSFSRNSFFNPSSSFWNYKATSNAALYQIETEAHNFYGAASGNASTAITWTQLLSFERGKTLALQGATTQTGTGITFPASQSASSDANTLDDYEEGTWTPFLQFSGTPSSGAVYSDQKGIYTKIGNMVYVQAYLSWTNKGTTTGVWQLGGLPFSTPSTGGTGGMANRASVGAIGNSYGTQKGTGLYGESSTTYFLPTYVNASGQLGELTQVDVSSSGQIFYGGYYRVA